MTTSVPQITFWQGSNSMIKAVVFLCYHIQQTSIHCIIHIRCALMLCSAMFKIKIRGAHRKDLIHKDQTYMTLSWFPACTFHIVIGLDGHWCNVTIKLHTYWDQISFDILAILQGSYTHDTSWIWGLVYIIPWWLRWRIPLGWGGLPGWTCSLLDHTHSESETSCYRSQSDLPATLWSSSCLHFNLSGWFWTSSDLECYRLLSIVALYASNAWDERLAKCCLLYLISSEMFQLTSSPRTNCTLRGEHYPSRWICRRVWAVIYINGTKSPLGLWRHLAATINSYRCWRPALAGDVRRSAKSAMWPK